MIHRNLVSSVGEVDHQRAGTAEQTAALCLVAEVLGVADEGAVVDHRTAGCTREVDDAARTRVKRAVVAGETAVAHGDRGVVRVDRRPLRVVAAPTPLAIHRPLRRQYVEAIGHKERIVHQCVPEVYDVDAEAAVVVAGRDIAVAGEDAVLEDERATSVRLDIHAAAVHGAHIPAVRLDDAAEDLERAAAGLDEAVLLGTIELDLIKGEFGVFAGQGFKQTFSRILAIEDRERPFRALVERRLRSSETTANYK